MIFIATEFFKLTHNRTARAIFWAMVLTPITIISIVWRLGTPYAQFFGVLQVIGGSLLLLLGLTALLLTASAVGDEYEQKTVRTVIGRGIPRWFFLVGKGVAIWCLTLFNGLTLWFVGSLMAIMAHWDTVGVASFRLGIFALLTSGLDAVLLTMLAVAVYIGIGTLLAVLTRSTAFTLFGGLGFFFFDFYLQAINETNTSLSILGNTAILFSQLTFPFIPADIIVTNEGAGTLLTTSPSAAILILLTYTLITFTLAIALFRRQELT
ncbi:MAG TPA: ABC transporter permease subunit [Anaerolineae bacterium]|nr:ABC transporter permease subunit [Anaerolineae bacterium]